MNMLLSDPPRSVRHLVRAWTFCHISASAENTFSPFLQNLKAIYECTYIEKADLGKQCLLLHNPSFPR